jgi:circadian clock protein KaiC
MTTKRGKTKKSIKTKIKVIKSKASTSKRSCSNMTASEKIPTDVSTFDNMCYGGFNKESVNLIVGGAGSGKTIFSIQFLFGGLERGEKCMYITFEEKKEELYRNMFNLGFDLEKYEKTGKFIFVEYSPEKVKSMLEEGGGTLESIVYKEKINRLVIDSITSFTLLFESELSKREAALSLFDIIKRWKCTVLLTMEKELSKEELISGSESAMEFEVDSVILIFYLRLDGPRKRLIEILKMRGTKHSREIFPFEIGKGGINISKKPERHLKLSIS